MMLWMVTNSTSNGLPTSTSYRRVVPPAWLWQSMKPGTTVMPLASKVCVFLPMRPLISRRAPDGDEPAALDREGLGARRGRVHRVDLGVEDDQVGIADR